MNHDDDFRVDDGAEPRRLPDEYGHLLEGAGAEPELAALAARLDEMGSAETAWAEQDWSATAFEDRLVEAARAAVSGKAAAMDATPTFRYVAAPSPARASLARRPFAAPRLAAAAAVGIVATLGAAWLSGRPASGTSVTEQALALEQDLDQWLSMPDVLDDSFDAELAAIHAAAAHLSRSSDEAALDGSGDSWAEEGAL